MYGRTTMLFPLTVMAVLALLTLWIEHSVKTPTQKLDGSSRHDPDYYLENFFTSKTDAQGNLRYKLAAVEMKHFPDDESTSLVRPRFTQYGIGKPYTQIEGQKGVVSKDGKEVDLYQNVKVSRPAFAGRGEMGVFTEYLKIIPDKDLVTSDQVVTITQAPKTVIRGTGMIYNKKTSTLTLLKKVRVHYERPGTQQATQQKKRKARK
jgi:lipopolysaccharide export system protein LptC